MTRRRLLKTIAASAAARPNLVLLLADDMGWGDPSCYGNTALETPNLDALAASGTRFENFYSASAVCSPSRAAILTGRYPIRFDIRKAFSDDEAHLPRTTTLPGLLQQAGYATAHVGKWHLGGLHQKHIRNRAASIPGPHQHGFHHYQCQNEEQPLRGEMGRDRILFRRGGTCLIRDEQNIPATHPYYHRHFEDTNGDEATRLIGEFHNQRRPFFLNVWFLAPHAPYEPAPEPFWSKAAAAGISYDQKCYRSMVMHMDHQVGRILRALDERGLRENTMILFTSDNGGAWEANIGPYRGGKTDLHEGGIRVPGILSFPGRVAKGALSGRIAHHCDVLPTFCAAAAIKAPANDGENLLAPQSARTALFWQIDIYKTLQRHYPKPKPYATEALRSGEWKLMAMDGKPVALYNLKADPLESTNLLDRQPAVVARLAAEVRAFLTAGRNRGGFPAPAC